MKQGFQKFKTRRAPTPDRSLQNKKNTDLEGEMTAKSGQEAVTPSVNHVQKNEGPETPPTPKKKIYYWGFSTRLSPLAPHLAKKKKRGQRAAAAAPPPAPASPTHPQWAPMPPSGRSRRRMASTVRLKARQPRAEHVVYSQRTEGVTWKTNKVNTPNSSGQKRGQYSS